VDNIVLVSNEQALETMAATARRLGYDAVIVASDMYDEPPKVVARMREKSRPHTVVLGGGEPRLVITEPGGDGGRNQHVALTAAAALDSGEVYASVASDGMDNGDSAGALVDDHTLARARAAGIDPDVTLAKFNERPLLEKTADLLFTGPTGANVSDLMLLLTP
jgi:glycerate-2-kinase